VICIGNDLHLWAVNLKKLARQLKLPFLPLCFDARLYFLSSMGVWAMRSLLLCSTIYQPALTESESNQLQNKDFFTRRTSCCLQTAQELRKTAKSSFKLLSSKYFNPIDFPL